MSSSKMFHSYDVRNRKLDPWQIVPTICIKLIQNQKKSFQLITMWLARGDFLNGGDIAQKRQSIRPKQEPELGKHVAETKFEKILVDVKKFR